VLEDIYGNTNAVARDGTPRKFYGSRIVEVRILRDIANDGCQSILLLAVPDVLG
jgi:hypothetical protein